MSTAPCPSTKRYSLATYSPRQRSTADTGQICTNIVEGQRHHYAVISHQLLERLDVVQIERSVIVQEIL